jgi:predicted  nucleic acid-binding Zn-ribbon protein
MNPANYLYRLQKLDTKKSQVVHELKEIEQKLRNDQILILAQTQNNEVRNNCENTRQHLHQIENQVKAQKIKIEQSESTLYGGNVKNPKELQDIQAEISSFKRQLSHLEDEQLEALIGVEELEKCEKISRENLEFVESQAGSEKKGLIDKMSLLNHEYERLSQEYDAAKQSVPADLFILYVSIRDAKRGIAVTQVSEGACDTCGSPITPGEWQIARTSSEIRYCPSCGRILFAS